jgi:hypothetical protein
LEYQDGVLEVESAPGKRLDAFCRIVRYAHVLL